jgi:hypothetical protein
MVLKEINQLVPGSPALNDVVHSNETDSDNRSRKHTYTSILHLYDSEPATIISKSINVDNNTVTNISNSNIKSGAAINISKLAITGTPDGTKFLRDDGSWQPTAGGGEPSDGDKGDIIVTASGLNWTIDNSAISNLKMANMSQNTIKGRITASTGAPEDLTAANVRTIINVENGATADQTGAEIKTAYEAEANTNAYTDAEKTKLTGVATNANNYSHPNHTGDVTSTGDGATVISNDAVSFGKIQNINTAKVLGRNTAASGDIEEISQISAGEKTAGTETALRAFSPKDVADMAIATDFCGIATFDDINNTNVFYYHIDALASFDNSVHNRKIIVSEPFTADNLKVNFRTANINSTDTAVVAIYNNTTQTALKITLDSTYTADTIQTNSADSVVFSEGDYISIGVDFTDNNVSNVRFGHISFRRTFDQ